jgi:hypothetical protein
VGYRVLKVAERLMGREEKEHGVFMDYTEVAEGNSYWYSVYKQFTDQ